MPRRVLLTTACLFAFGLTEFFGVVHADDVLSNSETGILEGQSWLFHGSFWSGVLVLLLALLHSIKAKPVRRFVNRVFQPSSTPCNSMRSFLSSFSCPCSFISSLPAPEGRHFLQISSPILSHLASFTDSPSPPFHTPCNTGTRCPWNASLCRMLDADSHAPS